jgi:hypothetical protein
LSKEWQGWLRRKKLKSKRERQRWWNNLSPEEQNDFIERIVAQKSIFRRNRSLERMKKYGDKYPCSECFHRLTKSCTDHLPNGCEYWWMPNSRKIGIAYKQRKGVKMN